MTAVPPVEAFLLAGGQSRRMGRDKAAMSFDSSTFAETIAATVRPVVSTTTIVGRAEPLGGLRAVSDLRPGCGPLAGIETALSVCASQFALVLACDIPLVSRELVEFLFDEAFRRSLSIVVPLDAGGRVSPLCGVYPKAALPTVSALLDAGERMPRALFRAFSTIEVPFEDYAHLPRARDLLRNVNTPEDYVTLPRGSASE